ncbi:uncharacterized protein [Anoplolepis gracilipes]|uniref:uncharacterized protein n=1 Tax=Anoplolepis gracilipes TaxID=354296 RepID=UPI003BA08C6F
MNLMQERVILCYKNMKKQNILWMLLIKKIKQKKIRNIEGKSAENHLVNCLVMTTTNGLAKQLTWEGQRQTEGIKNTPFSNIILGIISNTYNSSSYYIIKNKFCEWLRRAGDRYRYELKKFENSMNIIN